MRSRCRSVHVMRQYLINQRELGLELGRAYSGIVDNWDAALTMGGCTLDGRDGHNQASTAARHFLYNRPSIWNKKKKPSCSFGVCIGSRGALGSREEWLHQGQLQWRQSDLADQRFVGNGQFDDDNEMQAGNGGCRDNKQGVRVAS